MATYLTMEYGGTERCLADWGFAEEGVSSQFANMMVDTLNVHLPAASITGAEIIPYEGAVILRSGRASSTGLAGSFSGGVVEFQGKRLLHVLEGRPDSEGVTYQFGGPWYDIDATCYQQEYMQYAGTPPVLCRAYSSDVYLFMKMNDVNEAIAITNGEMITRILAYCLSVVPEDEDAPFRIGTIEPAVNLNAYPARDLKCSEAIHHCMRASPDCAVQFDYTTVPPTVNVRRRTSVTPKSVTFSDGIKHESITLTPRYDLQPAGVVIRFKQANQIDDVLGIQTTTQKYPVDCAEGGRGVIVQTVDLQGYNATRVKGKLECVAFTNDRTWWKTHFADLKTTRTRRFRIGPLTYTDEDTGKSITLSATTIKDKDGNDVDPETYPNQLVDGASIAPWMTLTGGAPVVGVKVTITAEVSCKEYNVEASGDPETSTNGRLLSKYPRKQIEAHVTLTNGVTGNYSALASFTQGELIPTGMAQAIAESLALLQYQGTFTVVESECATAIRPGDTLNITNGRTEWATMKALVQQVSKTYGQGRTVITIGPATHLSAGDLTQMFLINRRRVEWKNPSVMSSGRGSHDASTAEFGDKAPHQNSLHGIKEPSQAKITARADGTNTTEIHHDAEGGAIEVSVRDTSGATVANKPRVLIKLEDLQYAGTADAETNSSRLRRVHWADTGGAKWRAYALFTKAESDVTDDGHSETGDIYVGGGGGGVIQCQITSLFNANYLGVKKFNNAAQVGSEFKVAKSMPGRMPGGATVEGTSFAYTYVDDNHRTSNDGTTTEAQVMFPRFNVGDVIYVASADYSGVSFASNDLKFIEVNTAREWTKKYIMPT